MDPEEDLEQKQPLISEPPPYAPAGFEETSTSQEKGILPLCGLIFGLAFLFGYTAMPFFTAFYIHDTWAWWIILLFLPLNFCVGFGVAAVVACEQPLERKHGPLMCGLTGIMLALLVSTFTGLGLGFHAANMYAETARVTDAGLQKDICPSVDPTTVKESAIWWQKGTHFTQNDYGQYPYEYNCGTYRWPEICHACVMVQPVYAGPPCTASNEISYWAFRGGHSCDMPPMERGAILMGLNRDKWHPPICKDHYADDDATLEDFYSGSRTHALESAKNDFLRSRPNFKDRKGSQFVFMCTSPFADAQDASDAARWNFCYHMVAVWVILLPALLCVASGAYSS